MVKCQFVHVRSIPYWGGGGRDCRGWRPGILVGVGEVYASSCCDYPLSICGQGSGHIGQRCIVQWTHCLRDATVKDSSSNGLIVQGTHRQRTFIRDTSVGDISSLNHCQRTY